MNSDIAVYKKEEFVGFENKINNLKIFPLMLMPKIRK